MSDSFCKTCGQFMLYPDSHQCPPEWSVSINGESWFSVHARDAEGAAEKGAEAYDIDGDYTIIRSGSAKAKVRLGDGPELSFEIEAESRPHYNAWPSDDR